LASCTFQVWYNLTKVSFQVFLWNYVCINSGSSYIDNFLKRMLKPRSSYIDNFLKKMLNSIIIVIIVIMYILIAKIHAKEINNLTTIKKIPKDIQYTYNCKLNKLCEMLLTTLEHNQQDVIDVIWRLPVWNVKIDA
jgi:hypothetical protein